MEKKESEMLEKVKKILDDEIRPWLQADGGDAEVVEITDDGVVKVKLIAACATCPMAQMTLKMGIEKRLKEKVPGVKRVEAV